MGERPVECAASLGTMRAPLSRLTVLVAASAIAASSLLMAPSAPAGDLGAEVTAVVDVSPARYEPGVPVTVTVTGALTTVAQRDVVCHSLDTRVFVGRVEIGGSLDSTDRTVQRSGESHTQSLGVDVDIYAPDRGTLIVQLSLQCSPVSASGDWRIPGAASAVIWTGRIQPTATSLTVSPAVVFPDAEEFTSQARITASAARGPITLKVSLGGRQVWSMTSSKPRVSVNLPSSRLTRSGTYTVSVTGGDTARFVVHTGWAPLYDGTIARWPRCSTITWRYDDAGAPRGGDDAMVEDLRKVFDRYAALTGLRFVEGGNDIVIGWADLPDGTNAEAGAGLVSQTLSDGFLRLSRTADRPRVPGFGAAGRGVTLLHELGHVLGLGHVSKRSLLMYPVHSSGSPLTPQAGDIAGLKELYAPSTCR